MNKEYNHIFFYLFEILVIGGGFILLLSFPFTFSQQLLILASILFVYIVAGLIHHKQHFDIKTKVVLEYILISVLIMTLFVFLNSVRI
jgi:hypothetical protein